MALTELLAVFKTQVDTAPLKKGEKDVGALKSALMSLGGIIAGAALIGGFRSMTAEVVGMADDLANQSARLKESTDNIQRWGYFLQKAGGEATDVEPLFKKLQQNIGSVGGQASKAAPLLKQLLGADYKTEGKSLSQVATDVGTAIGKMTDENAQAVAVVDLFGRPGTKLLPLFRQGAEGMAELNKQFEAFGGGISAEAIEQLGGVDDAIENYDLAMRGAKATMVSAFAPAMTTVIAGAGRLVAAFKSSSKGGENLRNILIGVGGAAAVAGLKAIAPWAAMAGALLLVGLVVDDLIVAFQGGESASAKLLDKLFGKGVGKSVFKDIATDLKDVVKEIKEAGSAGEALEKTFSKIGGSLTKFFVDELPAAIGVATGQMKEADATWADLFDPGGNRKKARERERVETLRQASKNTDVSQLGIVIEDIGKELAKNRETQDKIRARRGTDDAMPTDAFDLSDLSKMEGDLVRAKNNAIDRVQGTAQTQSMSGEAIAGLIAGAGGTTNQLQASNVVNVNITTTDAEALGDAGAAMNRALNNANKAAAAALTQVGNPSRTSGSR